jgi:hypothetical protein
VHESQTHRDLIWQPSWTLTQRLRISDALEYLTFEKILADTHHSTSLILESLFLQIVNGRDDPSGPFRMILMVAPVTGKSAPFTATIGRGILGIAVLLTLEHIQ